MDNKEFLDKINRAYLMEEEMAGELINFCLPDSLPGDLPKEDYKRIEGILLGIKADTLRHREILSEIRRGLL
ncbi:MAG: hypothetical protein PHO40_03720 [Candidatus Omnitrophica bacterium]|jgi:hypothetical protein|nr:hypothetical protein [Candidatus Omnitrophota bacterium]